ncbi:hypothetical protein PLESTM_000856200 [Pleodorina starrii]|nr:hypothetical protein PLESTM_000856200 [Pleodorina starrii]
MIGIDRRCGTGVRAPVDAPDVLTELERIRQEQAKTNELLRQILVPLAFISSCCSAMLNHLQQLAASCNMAVVLLEDCCRTLRAVLYDTSNMAALLSAAATVATHEGLLYEHAIHAARGMNLSVAACLLTGAAVGLPYRWRACRAPLASPPPRVASGLGRFVETAVPGLVATVGSDRSFGRLRRRRRRRHSWMADGCAGGAKGSGAQRPRSHRRRRRSRAVLMASDLVADVRRGQGRHVGEAWRRRRLELFGSGGGGGSDLWPWPRQWWWWWCWDVGGREASVLVCRTRMTGGFMAGSLVLVLWTAARCYLALVRGRDPPPQLPSAGGGPGGCRGRWRHCQLPPVTSAAVLDIPHVPAARTVGGGGASEVAAAAPGWDAAAVVVIIVVGGSCDDGGRSDWL